LAASVASEWRALAGLGHCLDAYNNAEDAYNEC